MNRSLTNTAIVEIGKLLSPIERLNNAPAINRFINTLGWKLKDPLQDGVIDLSGLITVVSAIMESVIKILESDKDDVIQSEILNLVKNIPDAFRSIRDAGSVFEGVLNKLNPEGIDVAGKAGVIAQRIIDYLVYDYLLEYHPSKFAILHVLGIAEEVNDSANMTIRTIQWSRIPSLLTNPKEIFNDVYQWETDFDGDEFLTRLEILLRAFSIPGGIYKQSATILSQLSRSEGDEEIRIPLFQSGVWPETYAELDLNISPIPDKPNGNPPVKAGLYLYPYIYAAVDADKERLNKLDTDLSNEWSIQRKGNADLGAGLGLEIRPPTNIKLNTGLFDKTEDFANANIELGITRKTINNQLSLIFGSNEGSRLGYKEIGFLLKLALEGGSYLAAIEMAVEDLTLVIDVRDGDGFIQKILSGVVLESVNDLVVGISTKEGFYFRGSSTLSIAIPIHKSLGPVDLNSILIGIGIGDEILVTLAVSFGLELGPIAGSVKNVGIQLPLSFPDNNSGNLGPVNVNGVRFLPPTGAGLVVNAGGITGGGYLEFDRDNERYAGILELNFGDLGLVAVGLITTRMPDGNKGFSMLILIGIEFSPVIQLGYGFTLSAVGGLIGINRQANVDFLREGLRAKTLDSILFPENPIANADTVISNLRNAFPPAEGRFIVGPMVKIGWGTPNLLTIDLCILLELPNPIRIILLGQIAAELPKADSAIVVLHLDMLGVLDIDKKSLSLDGTIYDSRILTYSLFGDVALRLNSGDQPDFAMSLGGFHPNYKPPVGFPSLRRLTLALSAGDNLKLSSEVYLALTANTLQFGSNIQLYAKFAGAELQGYLGFDTLIYFSPFSFIASMRAGVSVKYKGHRLASIRLFLELSGPAPWRAVGEASFSILLWDVSVDFDKTWGPAQHTLIDAKDPWIPLEEALNRNESYSGSLGRIQQVESYFTPPPTEVNSVGVAEEEKLILVHPAGGLEVRENVLPLNHTLEQLGNAPVISHNRFEVHSINSAGEKTLNKWSTIEEFFAPAQYNSMSDSQKLSLPSYEKMPGGVKVLADTEIQVPNVITQEELTYESILIDDDGVVQTRATSKSINWQLAKHTLLGAAQSKAFSTAKARSRPSLLENQVKILEEAFVIVSSQDLQLVTGLNSGSPMNQTTARQVMAKAVEQNPSAAGDFMVVSLQEIEA